MTPSSINQDQGYRAKRSNIDNARKAIKLLLGRDPFGAEEIKQYLAENTPSLMLQILDTEEFRRDIYMSTVLTGHVSKGRYTGQPGKAILSWIEREIPLCDDNRGKLHERITWRNLLVTIWRDELFLASVQESAIFGKSIQEFQIGLKKASNSKMYGDVPKLTTSQIQIPNCKLLIVERPNFAQSHSLEEIDLAPKIAATHNLLPKLAYIGSYDPQIVISETITGRFMLNIEIDFTRMAIIPDATYMQIFLDFGGGFSESASYAVGIVDKKICTSLILESEQAIRGLRIDPSVHASSFIINRLSLLKM